MTRYQRPPSETDTARATRRSMRRLGLAVLLGSTLALTGLFGLGQRDGQADDSPVAEAEPKAAASVEFPPEAISAQIDNLLAARMREMDISAADLADDATFLRRAYLDVLGTIPSAEVARAFVASRDKAKRGQLIEKLLASEAYGEAWGVNWYKWLSELSPAARGRMGQGARFLTGPARTVFLTWLKDQMAANRPYNAFVRDMLSATGRTDENGATGFYARWSENINNLAGATSKIFLGTRIQCAQCHDHIYEEDWKQSDFQGMAAFWATTQRQPVPEAREYLMERNKRREEEQARKRAARELGNGTGDGMDGESMDGEGMDGEMGGEMQPERRMTPAERRAEAQERRRQAQYRYVVDVKDQYLTARQISRMKQQMERRLRRAKTAGQGERLERFKLLNMTPKFWMGDEAMDMAGISRRHLLSAWVTSDENVMFSRALVNRYWSHFLGSGFVNPIDDFNSFNTASHPQILELLAKDFVASGYDLKRLVRIITSTDAYQRSSHWKGKEAPDASLFAVARVRPLDTEQLYHSLVAATGLEDNLSRLGRRRADRLQQAIFSAFSFVFDDDESKEAQTFEGSISQGLFLMNGSLMNEAVRAQRGNALDRLLRAERTDGKRIESLYWLAFGREPTAKEKGIALRYVRKHDEDAKRPAYEDLYWALLNSTEFTTNH